jgi:hypothetical protein
MTSGPLVVVLVMALALTWGAQSSISPQVSGFHPASEIAVALGE